MYTTEQNIVFVFILFRLATKTTCFTQGFGSRMFLIFWYCCRVSAELFDELRVSEVELPELESNCREILFICHVTCYSLLGQCIP